MSYSRQEILLAGGLAGLAALVGWLTEALGTALLVATVLWLAVMLRERTRLVRWSLRPLSRPRNEQDPWQEMAYRLYRTIRRARKRHAQTLKQLKTVRAITDALPDAALILDRNGNIENLNNAARAMLHLERSDLGNHLASLVREPEFNALLRGQIDGNLVEFTSPFNEQLRLEARRIVLTDGQSMVLVRDVTELNRLLSMRQDFIANVSHELRTPLTVIVGYLESLMQDDLDPETVRTLISKLRSPTVRMQALVDDLLLLTRLESSPNPSVDELAPVDMGCILRSVAADAEVLSRGKHRIRIDQQTAMKVLGMEGELHSACLNLVTNAVRYSPDGGEIRIRWSSGPEGARLAVEDQGMGIPKEHLSRITERFYRVDLAHSRVRGGTGLGLAIVKHVLKRHNSRLQVESEPGRGSTFYCDFPHAQLAGSDTHN